MKRLLVLLMALLVCLSQAGCNVLLDDSFISVKPYSIENPQKEGEEIVAKTYVEVRQALMDLVDSCAQSAIISVPTLDERIADYYMSAALNYIMHSTALGAYAVKQVDYEIGTNVGDLAIAVDITYNFNRVEILRIPHVDSTHEAITEIQKALQQCEADITMYVENYAQTDLVQLVQDYVDRNPQYCMEMPQVTAAIYPDSGRERILSLTFSYRNSREVLRGMQSSVSEVFAQVKPEGDTRWERYANLYEQLMKRHESYIIETSITPSYSLLRHGVGDSKAFATVYSAICEAWNLNCEVISGTKGGEAWYWNAVLDNGVYYHIDLLRCNEEGQFHMMEEEDMTGYVWDYSAYPGSHG